RRPSNDCLDTTDDYQLESMRHRFRVTLNYSKRAQRSGRCGRSQLERAQRRVNCARQRGLSSDILDTKQDAMRSLLGIAELHSMRASPMQAARCSGVYRISADAAVGSTARNSPTAPSTP